MEQTAGHGLYGRLKLAGALVPAHGELLVDPSVETGQQNRISDTSTWLTQALKCGCSKLQPSNLLKEKTPNVGKWYCRNLANSRSAEKGPTCYSSPWDHIPHN